MLTAPAFSDRTFNFLADDLNAVDWLLKAEALDKEKSDTLRELRDTRIGRKPSNVELQATMLEILFTGTRYRGDDERQRQLKAIVSAVEDALQHDHAARRMKLEKIEPVLREFYTYYDKTLLSEEFTALGRPDDSKDVDARIAALESKIEKIERRIEGHRGNVLKCFRGGVLPQVSDILAINSSQDMGLEAQRIGEYLIRRFAQEWRVRAPLFEKPVSVHGTLIDSMDSKRRETWQKAYDAMRLGELKKLVRYAPRIEPRQPAPVEQLKGQFFEPKKVSTR